jgi:hypothetical protein
MLSVSRVEFELIQLLLDIVTVRAVIGSTSIAARHPDLFPEHRERVAETLADPDQVRRSARFGNARTFSRWYTDVKER